MPYLDRAAWSSGSLRLLSSYGSRGGGGGGCGGPRALTCSSLFDERPDPACEVDAQADERDRKQAIQELEAALVDPELRHRESGHVPLKIVDPIIRAADDILQHRRRVHRLPWPSYGATGCRRRRPAEPRLRQYPATRRPVLHASCRAPARPGN